MTAGQPGAPSWWQGTPGDDTAFQFPTVWGGDASWSRPAGAGDGLAVDTGDRPLVVSLGFGQDRRPDRPWWPTRDRQPVRPARPGRGGQDAGDPRPAREQRSPSRRLLDRLRHWWSAPIHQSPEPLPRWLAQTLTAYRSAPTRSAHSSAGAGGATPVPETSGTSPRGGAR